MKDCKGNTINVGDYVEIIVSHGPRPIGIVTKTRVCLSYGARVEVSKTGVKSPCYYCGNDLIVKEPEELI